MNAILSRPPAGSRLGTGLRVLAVALVALGLSLAPRADGARTSSADRAVDAYLAAYRSAEPEAMVAVYDPNATFIDISQRHEVKGKAGLTEMMHRLVGMHASMNVEEKVRATRGDIAIVEVVYTGTLDTEAIGRTDLPPVEYELPAVLIFETSGGRILKQTDYLDFRTFTESFAHLQAPPAN